MSKAWEEEIARFRRAHEPESRRFPKCDWRLEVQNGDTLLGYWEWACKNTEEGDAEKGRGPGAR